MILALLKPARAPPQKSVSVAPQSMQARRFYGSQAGLYLYGAGTTSSGPKRLDRGAKRRQDLRYGILLEECRLT